MVVSFLKGLQVAHFLAGFAVLAALSLSLYAFYFVNLRSDTSTFYNVHPALYPLIFWVFPVISTIFFYMLQRGRGISQVSILNMIYFVLMYGVLFAFIISTRDHYTLSQNILEQEAAMVHILTFLGGLVGSFGVGKLIRRIFRHASQIHSTSNS
ncbi:MAG: hypothetical protein ACREBU_12265 [Nitrososphaera sp.]